METKQILINLQVPSLSDTPDGLKESLQKLRCKALDKAMLSIVNQTLNCGYDFEEILFALAAYPESQQWGNTVKLLEESALSARHKE